MKSFILVHSSKSWNSSFLPKQSLKNCKMYHLGQICNQKTSILVDFLLPKFCNFDFKFWKAESWILVRIKVSKHKTLPFEIQLFIWRLLFQFKFFPLSVCCATHRFMSLEKKSPGAAAAAVWDDFSPHLPSLSVPNL